VSPAGAVQVFFNAPHFPYQQFPPPPAPALGPDSTVYAAFDNILYALQGSGSPPATAPWPTARQNLRRTGRAERPSLAFPQKQSDAHFDLMITGELGQSYTVQSTTNFLNWINLTNFVATNVNTIISDRTVPISPARFYHVVSP